MKELSDQEFHSTFGERMIPIDFDNELLKVKAIITDLELLEPESAYRNERNTYEHHLIKTGSKNVFLVFVRDLKNNELNYHILDLNEKYGLK